MAVVGLRTQTWLNPDGLYQWFGTDEAKSTRVGHVQNNGRHATEVVIGLTDLPTVSSGNQVILSDTVTIPAGAFIEEVKVFVTKETAGTNATLDVGLVDQDRSTEIDFNGIFAALATVNNGTDLGELTYTSKGGTTIGALVGTRLTNTGLITANALTADFTAGVVKVVIYWSVPLTADV